MTNGAKLQFLLSRGISPIDSLSISIEGNVTANVKFELNAKVILLSDFNEALQKVESENTDPIINEIKNFISPLKEANTQSELTMPSIFQIKTLQLLSDNSLISQQLFELTESDVTVTGTIALQNDSPTPVTAKIFVKTLGIHDETNTLKIIDHNNPVLAQSTSSEDFTPIKTSSVNILKINS